MYGIIYIHYEIVSVTRMVEANMKGGYNEMEMLLAYMSILGILTLILYVLMVIANWKIFTKAGEAGWKSIIPIYNSYILFKISWKKSMFWIMLVIAFLTCVLTSVDNMTVVIIGSLLSIVTAIISIMLSHKLSKAFGHGVGFTLGLIFLSPIFMLILAFGDSQYIGNNNQ